jgi:hypothetical protein
MKYAPLFIACALLLACEKVIDMDLRTAEPRLVVEGNITNEAGPYTVRLSRTVDFSAPNEFPPVSGAIVTVSDNAGNAETLKETSPGAYQSARLKGTPGRTYELKVNVGDEEYTASSVMPAFVAIDTLIQGEKKDFGDAKIAIQTWFHDPAGAQDYYRFSFSVNGVPSETIFTFDAGLYDGNRLKYDLARDDDEEEEHGALPIAAGDTIAASLYHIDKQVHLYFLTLQQNSGDGPPTALTNPISNISNGALGYFSAHTVSESVIIIK